MKRLLLIFFILPHIILAQNFTSYITGNNTDTVSYPSGGICLMGGATEDDNAMKWFLQRANGGDILVLRTSGSNGYNSYLYSDLNIPVNSVETIVCHNLAASSEPYVLQKIQQAEAIWFAGGDQWNYITFWRNSPVDSLINQSIKQRKIVIGGTSAGMAIQGGYYFSAQNGTVTSATALANPFQSSVTVDSSTFISNDFLEDVITDTHFDNPDRKGRLAVFLARLFTDYGLLGKAIACDEYTAVCIDTNGLAKVFGGYPTYDDNAYFIQTNCELPIQAPENCTANNPLTWNLGGEALKVYQVKGSSNGQGTFDLNDWESGNGGEWLDWSIDAGVLASKAGNPIHCGPSSIPNFPTSKNIKFYPNPVSSDKMVSIETPERLFSDFTIEMVNPLGQKIPFEIISQNNNTIQIRILTSVTGLLLLKVSNHQQEIYNSILLIRD